MKYTPTGLLISQIIKTPVATPASLNTVGSPMVGKVEWFDNSLNQL